MTIGPTGILILIGGPDVNRVAAGIVAIEPAVPIIFPGPHFSRFISVRKPSQETLQAQAPQDHTCHLARRGTANPDIE
ncbi:hypothetical protein AB0B20_07225 [Micromonospora sp. NPDC049151]|uniref:hypothetical protein n=1 Tax=Micromonospora sp. NPDC049151 TaxID=3155648 RepID=UPI0033DECEA7